MADVLRNHLYIKVDELAVPISTRNRLLEAGIVYVGDLVQKTENELLHMRKFGKVSLMIVNKALAKLGLELGMTIPDWARNED